MYIFYIDDVADINLSYTYVNYQVNNIWLYMLQI